jgi:thiol-disulfide isomerase/thioredoxin
MKSDTVKVVLTPFGEKPLNDFKTIILKNGRFSLDTLISEPQEVVIAPNEMFKELSNGEKYPIPSKQIKFFLYPKNEVFIKGEMKDYCVVYEVNGNILNEQHTKYRNKRLDNKKLISKLMYEVENLYSKNAADSIIDIPYNLLSKISKVGSKSPINYIVKNSNLEYSAFLLSRERKNTIIELYPSLSEKVKKSDFGKLIENKIQTWKSISVEAIAPDFEYQTYKNGEFKLSENYDKYIVLDFWGSWCGPCIMEMPRMKEFYKKNKNKVEIIGIGARDKKEDWIKAIKENELDWKHILNNKEKDDLVKKYGVTGFPTKIIISKSGKIKGTFLGAKEDFFIKMNELLKE